MRKVSNKRLEKIIRNCCFYLPIYGTFHRINVTGSNYFLCTNEDTFAEVRVCFEDIDLAKDKFYTIKQADLTIERI